MTESKMSTQRKHMDIKSLQAQFLAMVPLRNFSWEVAVTDWQTVDDSQQQEILQATLLHPTSRTYPPSVKYMKTFLKHIINQIEGAGVEVCEDMYTCYLDMLKSDSNEDICHKTYTLESGALITTKESVQLISQGTTGLCTWQAAQYLAEWVTQHKNVVKNKNVLELGSGLGMTGSAICTQCQPNSFVFTDCHSQVMETLMCNVHLNFCKKCKTKSDSVRNTLFSSLDSGRAVNVKYDGQVNDVSHRTDIQRETENICCDEVEDCWTDRETDKRFHRLDDNSTVRVMQLDWEDFLPEDLRSLNVEVVLAADVVYDSVIIKPLVQLLEFLLQPWSTDGDSVCTPVAYIASTIRNPETKAEFLEELGKTRITHERVDESPKNVFFYDRSVPIELLKLVVQ